MQSPKGKRGLLANGRVCDHGEVVAALMFEQVAAALAGTK
jgi:hypothetical protein